MNHAILLISCPDRKGITAAVANFIAENSGNIIHADQHIDEQSNTFFMRLEWSLDKFKIDRSNIGKAFTLIADEFGMDWSLNYADKLQKVAVFVSKPLHCLYDLLLKAKTNQLQCEIPIIVSNHPDASAVAKEFGIEFFHMAVNPKNKAEQEARQIELMRKKKIDVIALARYHQILSGKFVNEFPNQIINIHHSFLPAFAGKNPYQRAFEKGVKIIGATSHYVTERLDEGPIIDQDTVRVSHRDSLHDMISKGEDLERVVLYRAVRWHLEKKILSYGNKTVVFD